MKNKNMKQVRRYIKETEYQMSVLRRISEACGRDCSKDREYIDLIRKRTTYKRYLRG